MAQVEVVAAILMEQDEILCMQRKEGRYSYLSHKFEFPGGKVEEGETREQALMRELWEEMDLHLEVTPEDFFMTVEHSYPDFFITLHCYLCRISNPEFVVKEHQSHQWLNHNMLDTLDWAEADSPVVKRLMEVLG